MQSNISWELSSFINVEMKEKQKTPMQTTSVGDAYIRRGLTCSPLKYATPQADAMERGMSGGRDSRPNPTHHPSPDDGPPGHLFGPQLRPGPLFGRLFRPRLKQRRGWHTVRALAIAGPGPLSREVEDNFKHFDFGINEREIKLNSRKTNWKVLGSRHFRVFVYTRVGNGTTFGGFISSILAELIA